LDDALRSNIITTIPVEVALLGETQGKRIGAMVMDVIENSLDQPAIRLSPGMLSLLNELKEWLFENVYLKYPVLYPDILKARQLVIELFQHYVKPGNLPEGFEGVQGAVDYVAGMTDRFAIETYARLKLPKAFTP
ncbi:MAG: deoxyguanosinetriphosphate triphosphohydrolase, partial [Fimbriimonadaceae bacterium]